MKNYNVKNYARYKQDLKRSGAAVEGLMWDEYDREDLIIKNMPMVESIARKFNTAQQASGILNLEDMKLYCALLLAKQLNEYKKLQVSRLVRYIDYLSIPIREKEMRKLERLLSQQTLNETDKTQLTTIQC